MAEKISKADLERGYSSTGYIPEDLEQIGEKDDKSEMMCCEEDSTEGGFLNRSEYKAMERY